MMSCRNTRLLETRHVEEAQTATGTTSALHLWASGTEEPLTDVRYGSYARFSAGDLHDVGRLRQAPGTVVDGVSAR